MQCEYRRRADAFLFEQPFYRAGREFRAAIAERMAASKSAERG
jgi:hypothetical protein